MRTGLRAALTILAIATVMTVMMRSAPAHPTPSVVPFRWELRFEPGPLRLFVDPIDRGAYWYFTYVVTNGTERDQIWAPDLVLFTDAGEILRAGDQVPSRVEEQLRELLGNELLETQSEIIGTIRQGIEHARDGLAVWPVGETQITELSLFIGGLSGETARITNPLSGEPIILRKTMERRYRAPGDPIARGSRPLEFISQRWVMR